MIPRQIIEQEKVRNDSVEKRNIEKDIIYHIAYKVLSVRTGKEITQHGKNRSNRNQTIKY